MSRFKVGDRVKARHTENVGYRFRGLLGTVTEVSEYGGVFVDFDKTGPDDNGGHWTIATLEKLGKAAQIQELLELEKERVNALIREKTQVEVELEDAKLQVISWKDWADDHRKSTDATLRAGGEQVEGLKARLLEVEEGRETLSSVLTYAMGRLSPEERSRVHGYWDALLHG